MRPVGAARLRARGAGSWDTPEVTRRLAPFLALCLVALAPARAAAASRPPQVIPFDVRSASLSEVVSFHGGPGCAQAGVCGYSGTISYGFGGIRDGGGGVILTRSRHSSEGFGFGTLDVGALTTASVSGPAGGPVCSERVLHKEDVFALEGSAGRLRVVFHPATLTPEFIDSYCVGPSDEDIAHTQALPTISLPTSKLSKRRVKLSVSTQRAFSAPPFAGTVQFSATLELAPSRLPSGLFIGPASASR
jgi:hypothetical protein